MANRNDEIVSLLTELGKLTILDEGSPQSFRARAYENAVLELKGYRGDIAALTVKELVELDGVGKSTAQKIREYFDSGKIDKLEKLREKYPPEYVQLSKIPGLGPKTLQLLRKELGVQNVDDLRKAIEAKAIRNLPRLGQKTEEKLASAIEKLGMTGKDQRVPIAEVMPVARQLVAALEAMPGVERARYCGSLRRLRETIADVDIVVAAAAPAGITDAVVELPMVRDIIGHGETKVSFVTDKGLQVDVRVVEPGQFGAAIQYFTGSKQHNIELRQRAIDRGWTLNEYGLKDAETGEVIAAETEESIYEALELAWVPEPMREGTGEVAAAAEGKLPAAVQESDLVGDLHVHTDLSGDGRSPLTTMLDQARVRGYRYIAITDHAENLPINGVSRDQLRAQWDELAAYADRHPDLTLLRGCELNIGPDGGLDYDPEFRASLDWCVAAVHSHFDLDQATQTKRIIAAMEDPTVNVIGHLSGRMIGRRPAIDLDIAAVLEAAVDTNTAIEINSALPRLDAAADVLRQARDLNVTFVISTDAHHVTEMTRTQWGALQAQRGWVDRDRVANTWPLDRFTAWARGQRDG